MKTEKLSTLAVHAGEEAPICVPAVATPIYQTTTYRVKDSKEAIAYLEHPEGHYLYSRLENPTVQVAEAKIAALEAAEAACAFSSGMAAIAAALTSVVKAGDALLVSDTLYGETVRFTREILGRFGVKVVTVKLAELAQAPAKAPENARALYFETPTNPTLRVVDVPAVAAACRARGLASILDATFATPVNLRALPLGVDLVVHSATKYLNGHHDHLCGAVAGSRERVKAVSDVRRTTGGSLDPAAAYDLIRGMKTLAVRVERQNQTALAVARALEKHEEVARVLYPMLGSHPDHALAKKLLRGGGGVFSFSVKGGFEAVCRVHDALKLVARATSLGGVETIASIPVISSHRQCTDAELAAQGIDRGMIRISVGLEDEGDILADFEQALAAA